jgi:hypothetical protein
LPKRPPEQLRPSLDGALPGEGVDDQTWALVTVVVGHEMAKHVAEADKLGDLPINVAKL